MGVMKFDTTEPVATHLIPLVQTFELSMDAGPVLEIGTGYFSTLWLHHLATTYRRELWSYESKRQWHARALRYANDWHHIEFCDNWADAPIERHWGMVFIDHSPAQRRHEDVLRLADHAEYIVLHDSQPQSDYEYLFSRVWDRFRYRYDYKRILPWTSVVSNYHELESLQCA